MKKTIGILATVAMVGGSVLAQKVEPSTVTIDDIRQAYSEIKGDMAKAEQCLAMCEALGDEILSHIYAGNCLRTLKRYEDARAAFQRAADMSQGDSGILDRLSLVVITYYDLGQYQAGIDMLRAAIAEYSGAKDTVQSIAFYRLADGLTKLGDHKESNQALLQSILLRMQGRGVVDVYVQRAFDRLRPGDMTAEEYTTALADIIKITPATEENAEFLGRVKSELEKMK